MSTENTAARTFTGSCLCGAVTLAMPTEGHVEACHCGMCRKWGGGPLLALAPAGKPQFDGTEHIASYSSSEWAERAFCKQCGTHLYYRLKGQDHYAVPAGLFDDTSGFSMIEQIFIDKKPDYYDFANDTPRLTEKEVFEKFGVS
jgi:hypothetical protein